MVLAPFDLEPLFVCQAWGVKGGDRRWHKVSDEFTVPLCRTHHRELHQRGDERIWWQQLNIMLPASALWAQTHPALAIDRARHRVYETKPIIATNAPSWKSAGCT
jgi:hypothetical protein